MTTPLFLDSKTKISFPKLATAIKLSDNVDNWQREVSSEIFKYLPFLADYSVNVMIQRANPERGYAYGSAQVVNKSDSPPTGKTTPVVIPIIVTDRMLKPLDVFFHGDKAYPLSEDRVRALLFDHRTFETSDRKPTDQGMVDQLYPPIRTNYGYGAGVTTGAAAGGAGFGKFASLIELIAPTITDDEAQSFVSRLTNDDQLATAVFTNDAFAKAAAALVDAERVPVTKTAQLLVSSIKPTVVQFIKQASGNFKIKWANAEAFSPQEQDVTPSEAESMAGTEAVQGMQPDQAATLGTEQAKPPLDTPDKVSIQEFGQYQVRVEETGQDAIGWVLPVIDFNQNNIGLLLFTDGQSYSLQSSMAGSRVGNDINDIPLADPQGDGSFIYVRSDGSAVALPPVTIQNQVSDEQGNMGYICNTAFGDQIVLHLTPGLQTIEPMSEGAYGIPEDMHFTPLGQAVHITGSTEAASAVKEAQAAPRRAYIRSTAKDEFHLDGLPFHKLAKDRRTWLSPHDAEFLLVAAGLDQHGAREKLAAAVKSGMSIADGLNTITPLDHVHRESVKQAEAMLQNFPFHLRKDTVKIAATLEDTETADNILALSFLNPENLSIFASYLPQLDDTAQKLAEMLVAARFGMKQVDEGALERAMKNLEEVIVGIKAIQQKELL